MQQDNICMVDYLDHMLKAADQQQQGDVYTDWCMTMTKKYIKILTGSG